MLFLSIVGFGLNSLNSFKSRIKDKVRDIVISFSIGVLFSYGLIKRGMIKTCYFRMFNYWKNLEHTISHAFRNCIRYKFFYF